MKRAFLLISGIFFLRITIVQAQKPVHKKERLFSFNASLSDYSFLKTVRDSSITTAIKQKAWLKPANKSIGLGLSYWKGLTAHIDFSGTLTGSTINSSTINSTTINGGIITSATTINVGTDISVGNNIYIGDVSDRLTTKMIKFTGTSTISCKNDVLELSAEHVGFLGSTVDFSGASGIVWGSNTPAAVFG